MTMIIIFIIIIILIGGSDCDCDDRVTLKAYDVVSSLESTVIINVREYTIYLYEMRKKYGPDAVKYFRPASSQWWGVNIKNFIRITSRKKKIVATIDKKKISQYLGICLGIGIMNDNTILSSNMEAVSPLPDTAPKSTGNAGKANQEVVLQNSDDWGFYDDDGNMDDQFVNIGDDIAIYNDPNDFMDPLNAAPSRSKKESTVSKKKSTPKPSVVTPKVQKNEISDKKTINTIKDEKESKDFDSKASAVEKRKGLTRTPSTAPDKKETIKESSAIDTKKGPPSRKGVPSDRKVTTTKTDNPSTAESKKADAKESTSTSSKDVKDTMILLDTKDAPLSEAKETVSSDMLPSSKNEMTELFNTEVIEKEDNDYADDFDDGDGKNIVQEEKVQEEKVQEVEIPAEKVQEDQVQEETSIVKENSVEDDIKYDVDFEDANTVADNTSIQAASSIIVDESQIGSDGDVVEDIVDSTQQVSIADGEISEIVDTNEISESVDSSKNININKNNDNNYDEDFEA